MKYSKSSSFFGAFKALANCTSCGEALAVMAAAGLAILAYWAVDPQRDAERFYQERDMHMHYYAMKVAYTMLILAIVLNTRYLMSQLTSSVK